MLDERTMMKRIVDIKKRSRAPLFRNDGGKCLDHPAIGGCRQLCWFPGVQGSWRCVVGEVSASRTLLERAVDDGEQR